MNVKTELSYRISMNVDCVVYFQKMDLFFPICPQCERTIDREYQSFCDRCGQKLSWKNFKNAKIIYK